MGPTSIKPTKADQGGAGESGNALSMLSPVAVIHGRRATRTRGHEDGRSHHEQANGETISSQENQSPPDAAAPGPAPKSQSTVTFAPSAAVPLQRSNGYKGSSGRALTSTAQLSRRLSRQNSYSTLVAEASSDANEVLDEFGSCVKPEWSHWKAVAYGCLIDFAILLHVDHYLPIENEFTRCIISCGGAEQMRFLLALAQFDVDGNGQIDESEWSTYERLANQLIDDSVTLCGNLALVGTLVLGLTHLVTIGRPTPLAVSDESAAFFGATASAWLLSLAYLFSVVCECCAFFVLCCAIITRNCLTNVLPTREVKIDMLRTTNALGMQGVVTVVTLWSFLAANFFAVLVASPTNGWTGIVCFAVLLFALMHYVAPIRYLSAILLHEEVKRSLAQRGGSFRKKAGALSSMTGRMMSSV